jgi:predicted HicB family RNase H-like nuclease
MSLDISSKTEARLAAKAEEQGLSIDALLEQLLNEAGDLPPSTANGEAPTLPV